MPIDRRPSISSAPSQLLYSFGNDGDEPTYDVPPDDFYYEELRIKR